MTYAWGGDGRVLSGPELLLRYGVRRRLELRLGVPDLARRWAGGRWSDEVGDAYIGAKVALATRPEGDALGLIPGLSLPSGRTAGSSRSADPELKVTASHPIGAEAGLSAMSYGIWASDTGQRRAVLQQTASFDRRLLGPVDGFLEYAGTFTTATPDHVLHAGIEWAIGPGLQVDVHGGVSVGRDRAPFIAAGYSRRF